MTDGAVLTVMVLGEIGVVKSAVVNLIVGGDITRDSPDAEVCMRHTTRYEATMESMKVQIWEVFGFNQLKKDPKKNAPDVEEKFRPILEAKANVNVALFACEVKS
ncbi:hypothetical protein EV401DRAFT_2077585 [Pisolithus croceorrhizus]|nr:hypothetical protein EV401DRAFT_2077585 [Pisolithus croceorrhizus]